MRRITLFAKANVDVYDSLHVSRVGGEIRWNGINEVLRVTHPGVRVRLRHETASRSAALLEARGVVPAEVAARNHLLGAYPAASQFSTMLYDTDADAIILSILSDISSGLARRRSAGYLFQAACSDSWPEADRVWLREGFEQLERPTVEESMASFEGIVARIRQSTNAPILIYNLSPIIPGEWIHCYAGLEDLFSTRIRQFNLALIGLSEKTGVSIVDVEGVLGRAGADRLKLDVYHLTPEGYGLVAAEVVRMLADLGVVE